jgi:O-antigen ligase
VPNDVVYFIIAFSISITIIKPFIQRKWNSIFISIFTILLIFFSLNFGGRSILIYSLMLAIGIILDTRKNIKNATMVISGVGLIYLFLNYEKYDSAVYRLLNLSPICDGRIPQWLLAFEIGIENFWKGAGSSEFGRQWNNFVLNPVSDSCFYIDTRVISWPHNLLLEQFSFSGIFSLILLMYLLYSIVSFIFKSFKARILDEGLTFHFAVMVYILACLLDLTFYRLWVSVCFFMILYSVEFYFITNYYRRVK